MIHMHAADWEAGRMDPNSDRDLAHRVALRDARIATEYRAAMAGEHAAIASRAEARPSVLRRVRLALAGGAPAANVDISACCA